MHIAETVKLGGQSFNLTLVVGEITAKEVVVEQKTYGVGGNVDSFNLRHDRYQVKSPEGTFMFELLNDNLGLMQGNEAAFVQVTTDGKGNVFVFQGRDEVVAATNFTTKKSYLLKERLGSFVGYDSNARKVAVWFMLGGAAVACWALMGGFGRHSPGFFGNTWLVGGVIVALLGVKIRFGKRLRRFNTLLRAVSELQAKAKPLARAA
jgi:hypothetical protein